jgi:hypothetical protein
MSGANIGKHAHKSLRMKTLEYPREMRHGREHWAIIDVTTSLLHTMIQTPVGLLYDN